MYLRLGQTLPVLEPFRRLGHALNPPLAVRLFGAFRVENVQDWRGILIGAVKSFEGVEVLLPWSRLITTRQRRRHEERETSVPG